MKIKLRRQKLGWSQSRLAKEMGVEPSRISAIERGVYVPKLSTLRKLANALACTLADLLPDEDLPLVGGGKP